MIEDGAGFRAQGPQDGRGAEGGRPGSRMGVLGEDRTSRCGASGPGPVRMEQAGVQLVWPWGLDPARLFPALRIQSSPGSCCCSRGQGLGWGDHLREVEGGGGDVAATALAGRPAGLWEAWRGDSSERGAERNGAQLFPEPPGGPCCKLSREGAGRHSHLLTSLGKADAGPGLEVQPAPPGPQNLSLWVSEPGGPGHTARLGPWLGLRSWSRLSLLTWGPAMRKPRRPEIK